MPKYDHKQIEEKWQHYWEEHKSFRADPDSPAPKYYLLDMFPYPSGAGLHVGHPIGYTATDILARYKRAKGYNVLHPMGWDSFGLPAEQYAVRTGTHPAITTKENIDTYRRQLKNLGLGYDWEREIATTDPKFYKWTQWIFTKLYEKGLAYEAEVDVNYCPALGTVLANEEVEGGLSVIGGHPVEKRPLRQWMFKITAYADRLLEDLDALDWPEGIKRLQRAWIGRSEGIEIDFGPLIRTFTTSPETLFGITFLVLAPEHPSVDAITTDSHRSAVEAYRTDAAALSEVDRLEHAKHKTGVFTGGFAPHPITNEPIPVWVADYVLMSYGTGAVQAVPAHDERDFEFAQKYGLPVKAVIEDERLINSGDFDGQGVADAKANICDLLESKGVGKRTINYKLRDWLFSRQRYWGEPIPILHFEDGTMRCLELDELPLTPPEVEDYKPSPEGLSPLANVHEWVHITDPKTGKKARRETNTMPQWAGSCWYYMRYCDPHNDQAFISPQAQEQFLPVDLYIGGAEHAVLHLLYARFWYKVLYDLKLVNTPEPFPALRNQGLVTSRSFRLSSGAYISPEDAEEVDGKWVEKGSGAPLTTQVEKMSKSKLNVVNPDDIVADFGADSFRLYSMFMGPFDKNKVWNTDSVTGCRRFLTRFYEMVHSDKRSTTSTDEALKLVHRLIHDVTHDIEALSFNTAIAKMMSFVNDFTKLDSYPQGALALATQVLAPFAPHIAEELWEALGNAPSILKAPFPEADPKYLVDETVIYIVQVNGKLRGRFDLPKDQSEEAIVDLAKAEPTISKHLVGTLRKVVFVPNRLVNFVIS